MFTTWNTSSVQSECLRNRRDQSDLWVQLNYSRFSRMENLTLSVSTPKNLFDSLDSSSFPFPLQTLPGVARGMAGSDWLLTFFLKILCSFPPLPALTGTDHITIVKAAPPQQSIPPFTWGVHSHPLQQEFAERTWLGIYVALPWQNWSEKRFLTWINPGQHLQECFDQNNVKFIWFHSATVYKHGRKGYSDFVNVSKTFPLSLWEICMPMKYRINLLQSLTYKDFMFMLRLMFSMLQCSKQKSVVELSCKIIDFDTTTS